LDDRSKPVRFGEFQLEPALRKLTGERGEIRLGSRSMDLLVMLVGRAGTLISQRDLMAEIWPDTVVDDSSLRVCLSGLRRALSDGRGGHRYIVNEHGRGYRFVAPVSAALPTDFSPHPAKGDIPAQLVRLIGRCDEIDAVVSGLARVRLVTLVGPGGIGKSTLALAAAHQLSHQFVGGTQLIDLSLIETDEAVPMHVAAVLGAATDKVVSARTISAAIPKEPLLLLLDNCEHVLGGVAQLVEMLWFAAPLVSFLATSREPIRVREEQVLRLPGMTFPQREAVTTAKDALLYPAVELFAERATSASDFRLTDENAGSVSKLCRQLDGIPLAIEFAAGWIGLLPIEEIAVGLDDSLLTLTGGRRTAMPRHQTLFAALDWSYRTLSESERAVLDMMSVFRGSFTLLSAHSVAGEDGSATKLNETVASLVEKSLLTVNSTSGTSTYRLLATTRSYAARHLSERPDCRDFHRRHALSCVVLLRRSNEELLHLDRQEWVRKYGPLLADVRAALAWCFSSDGDPAVGVELTSVSSQLGMQSAMANDLRRYAQKAIDHLPSLPGNSEQETKLRFLNSLVDFDRTDVPAAGFEALARAHDQPNLRDDAPELLAAGWGANFTIGNYPAALTYAEKVLSIGRSREQLELMFAAKRMMAQSMHHLGQHDEARRLSEEVLACPFQFLPLTATSHLVSMRINLARIAFIKGNSVEGLTLAAEATELGRDNTPTAYCQALTHALIPLLVWTGDVEGALHAVEQLRKSSSKDGLQYWIDWTEALTVALDVLRPGGARHAERIDFALSRRRVPIKASDFLSTLEPSLCVSTSAQRVEDGTVLWCAPEVFRAQALATDDYDMRLQLLQKAHHCAVEHGATAWIKRAEQSIVAMRGGSMARETMKSSSLYSL
jgi:predicted ATPase/DNA-binding winged helix-turn-helix (wHTH) protein